MSLVNPVGGGEILGRERELEALDHFLEDAGRGPACLVLAGEPGIGKTTMWTAVVAAARERGYRVLACRPAGSEVRLSFAALADLAAGVAPEVLDELSAPQRRALEVALLLEDSGGEPPDGLALRLALITVLRGLARESPVLVALDDAQWLDHPTAAVLEFALRRLTEERVGLVVGLRRTPGEEVGTALPSAFAHASQTRLLLGPLSVASLHRLIRDRLGVALARPVLLRVHEVSGGNPFYGLELARTLDSESGRVVIPESLHSLVRRRLEELPRDVRHVLLAVASLSNATLSMVAAATDASRARSRIAKAVAAGVLELHDDSISFTHPLLASAVYAGATADQRRRIHRRLALKATDVEARGRHLALAGFGPDGEVAAALDRAAEYALARGAPQTAAELLELAVEKTPVERLPDLWRRKLASADAHFVIGSLERAAQILRSVLVELPPGDKRADVQLRLGMTHSDLGAALEAFEQAAGEVVQDIAVRARAHLLLTQGWPLRGIDDAIEHTRIAMRHAEEGGNRPLAVRAHAQLGLYELWAGRNPRNVVERGVELETPDDALHAYRTPRMPIALWQMYQGRFEDARAGFETLFSEAAVAGDELNALAVRLRLVDVAWRTGRWSEAAANARAAYELAEEIGVEHDAALSMYFKALLDAHLGRVTEAREAAEQGASLSGDLKFKNTQIMHLGVLGFLDLSHENTAEALRNLQPALDWLGEKGLGLATHPTAAPALEALIAAGDRTRARELVSRFGVEAEALESPWALAIAQRCQGLLAAADADLSTALESLEAALASHDDVQAPFERGRTLLALGRVQRRAKKRAAAKQSLEQALATFETLPAPLWATQARGELSRLGLRRAAADDRLTESERRVAELAAAGLTNRQVAARLFMSPKTVEAHLARTYRKLRIHSRAELGARLGPGASR